MDLIRIGVLTPHAAIGPEEEFQAIAPGRVVTRVVRVSLRSEDDPPTTPAGLHALTASPVLEDAAKEFETGSIDVVGYASTTSAFVIGLDGEEVILSRLSSLLGVPVASTCASAVAALRVLGVERVALIGAPWFSAELNELGATYFRDQGFDVVSSRSAALSEQPDRIEPDAVYDWTARHVADDAQAVFIGGNGFRAAGAVERLEDALGRPVLTSNQVLLWSLLQQARAAYTVEGYGRLFAHRLGVVRG